eukprot:symbB.v1.2.005703.t1/scaffold330.1/size228242/5
MAELGMHFGQFQELDAGNWLEELTSSEVGVTSRKFVRNLNVLGGAKKKEIPQGIKAEVDGLIIEGGEDAQDPPVLRAVVECKYGLSIYGDLQKLDALISFLKEADEHLAHFRSADTSASELIVKLPEDVEVKYFMGFLPEGDEGELERLLRPSVLRLEKGRLLQSAFSSGRAARCSMDLVASEGDAAPTVEVTLPEDQVAQAQERVNAFLRDVEVRMEQGKLSIHIRVAEEEKKLLMTLLF